MLTGLRASQNQVFVFWVEVKSHWLAFFALSIFAAYFFPQNVNFCFAIFYLTKLRFDIFSLNLFMGMNMIECEAFSI